MKQKVKKRMLKQRKLKLTGIKRAEGMDVDAEKENKTPGNVSAHELKERHTGEWKRMKAEVAELKKARKGIKKKGNKDEKKKYSKKIKELINTLTEKQNTERAQHGLEAQNPAEDAMNVDDDVDGDDDI